MRATAGKTLLAVSGILLLGVIAIVILATFWTAAYDTKLTLTKADEHYVTAHFAPTTLISRQWMNFAMNVHRDDASGAAVAARLYAYTAGVYDDALVATGSTTQASLATAQLLSSLMPSATEKLRSYHRSITGSRSLELSSAAEAVVASYLTRSKKDGWQLKERIDAPSTSTDAWYSRGHIPDRSERSGSWKTWFFDASSSEPALPPPPPAHGSLGDLVDTEKTIYATTHKEKDRRQTILLWDDPSEAFPGASGDDNLLGIAGLWQNILFLKVGSTTSELEYSRAQKLLAQAMADSYILTWRTKYREYAQSPSMRIGSLDLSISDGTAPPYVSEQATVSATAATILSSLFPAQLDAWEREAHDARYSRLVAGVEFDSAGSEGARYGAAIGERVLASHSLPLPNIRTEQPATLVEDALTWVALKIARIVDALAPGELIAQVRAAFSAIRFSEVSVSAGLPVDASRSVAWTDYNADGFLDLLSGGQLFAGNSSGTFFPEPGAAELRTNSGVLKGFADFDNDGCEDLFEAGAGMVSISMGDCKGAFVPTGAYGTEQSWLRARGVGITDYDHDGFVDLLLTFFPSTGKNRDAAESEGLSTGAFVVLLKNDGHGGFTDTTDAAGLRADLSCTEYPSVGVSSISARAWYQPIWFDYDGDGDDDLYLPSEFWIGMLFRNNGDSTFTDTTDAAQLCRPGTGMGIAVGDADGNGYPDIYVTNVGANYLWMNRGNGTFSEEGIKRHATDYEEGWGVELADFDNDGDLDLHVANASIPFFRFSFQFAEDYVTFSNRDFLYENEGSGTFIDVTEHAGISGNYLKYSSATADYDNDGKLDLYVSAVAHPAGIYNSLYRNDSTDGNHWLSLKLVGTKSNRDGIGAVATIQAGGRTQKAELIRGSSFLSQNSPWLHFGLGSASSIDSLSIRWPSGQVQQVLNPSIDQLLTITEPD